ncbi:MAG: hypothetical protein H0U06_12555 [Solirubrobacterales bacterium]|nr:hypothetical protein [Solirubrobacterales bacterium]
MSRHDLAFAAGAVALAAIGVAVYLGDWERFAAYPSFTAPLDAGVLALAALICLCVLLPFADRRGIGP